MKTITDLQRIADVQKAFEAAFVAAAEFERNVRISHPAGVAERTVQWVPKHDLWAHFGFPPREKSPGKRYWNVFGFGEPRKSVSIVCEINPPVEGVNRHAAGVFAEHGDEIHLFHRGKLNSFRGQIRRDFIRRHFAGVWLPVDDAGRETEMLHIGRVDRAEIVSAVADFAREVARIKQLYKNGSGTE